MTFGKVIRCGSGYVRETSEDRENKLGRMNGLKLEKERTKGIVGGIISNELKD